MIAEEIERGDLIVRLRAMQSSTERARVRPCEGNKAIRWEGWPAGGPVRGLAPAAPGPVHVVPAGPGPVRGLAPAAPGPVRGLAPAAPGPVHVVPAGPDVAASGCKKAKIGQLRKYRSGRGAAL